MKKYTWILVLFLLYLGMLACTNTEREGGPRLAGTITVLPSTPVSIEDAVDAINTYAQETLGITLQNLKAVGRSGEVNLPMSTKEGVDVALGLAGTTYFGLWKDGIASLSIGDSTVSGDRIADVEDGSLGTFWMSVNQPQPDSTASALLLIRAVYPGLVGVELSEMVREDVEVQGYEFVSKQADDIHIQDWGVNLTGTTIRAGVSPGIQQGKSIVWAVVASGALATPFDQP